MLVDTAVDGDSRVQKAARSAAEAGWDVTLLGRSPTTEEREWRLGRARVRLLPVGAGTAAGAVRRGLAALPRPLLRHLRRPVDLALVRYWSAVMGDRAWRKLEPALWDFETAFGPVVDELAPDLIHAHDFRMLGVGARAAHRGRSAGRPVKLVWDAHEYLPGITPYRDHARWMPAHRAYEREYAPYADAVVTVSEPLADLLRREHHLPETPAVVLNAPDMPSPPGAGPDLTGPDSTGPDLTGPAGPDADRVGAGGLGLRASCGVGPDVHLLVYCGMAAAPRGLPVVVEALPRLDGVHLALVVNQPDGDYVTGLLDRARVLGVADRVHVRGYVPYDRLVGLLSEADAGVIPLRHGPNHEIALSTKFFEYSHARLPIVVSDVRTMADTVRRTGQGEVFGSGDVSDYVRAVRTVLADPAGYRAAYDAPGLLAGWTWRRQAEILDGVYTRLLPADQSVGETSG